MKYTICYSFYIFIIAYLQIIIIRTITPIFNKNVCIFFVQNFNIHESGSDSESRREREEGGKRERVRRQERKGKNKNRVGDGVKGEQERWEEVKEKLEGGSLSGRGAKGERKGQRRKGRKRAAVAWGEWKEGWRAEWRLTTKERNWSEWSGRRTKRAARGKQWKKEKENSTRYRNGSRWDDPAKQVDRYWHFDLYFGRSCGFKRVRSCFIQRLVRWVRVCLYARRKQDKLQK